MVCSARAVRRCCGKGGVRGQQEAVGVAEAESRVRRISRRHGDLFTSENARSQRHDEERAAALRHKACERKNRYASRYEAELTAAECAEHGAPPLHVYHCPYCNGWHLTSKGE